MELSNRRDINAGSFYSRANWSLPCPVAENGENPRTVTAILRVTFCPVVKIRIKIIEIVHI